MICTESRQRCENGDLSAASSSSGKGRSRQELNVASGAGAEAIKRCGWGETYKRGVLGDKMHCHREESNSLRATNLVTFAECSPSNAADLCNKTLC
jgi:hypothetical protein